MSIKRVFGFLVIGAAFMAGVANAQTAPTPRLVGTITVRTTPIWVSPKGVNYDGKLPPAGIVCNEGFWPGMQRTPSASKSWTVASQRDLEARTARSIAPGKWNGEYYLVQYTTPVKGAIALFCLTDRDLVGQVTPDLDNDNDGIPNRLDNCPDVPGLEEDRGCPKLMPRCVAPQVLNETEDTCIDPPAPKAPPTCKPNEALKDGLCVAVVCGDTEDLVLSTKPGEDAKCVAKQIPNCAAPSVLAPDGKTCVLPPVADAPKTATTKKPPLYKRPVFWWTVGGVAAAATAVGVIIAVTRRDRGLEFESTPNQRALVSW